MPKYNDYPLYECAAEADKIIKKGGEVYQKFTCGKCGSRQCIDTPNVFHLKGKCEECSHITDLKITGCNYMVIGKFALMKMILNR